MLIVMLIDSLSNITNMELQSKIDIVNKLIDTSIRNIGKIRHYHTRA